MDFNEIEKEEYNKKKKIELVLDELDTEFEKFDMTQINENLKQISSFDIEVEEQRCRDDSLEFLENLAQIYAGDKTIIHTDLYIKARITEDLNILKELKFQQNIANFSIKKLVENISVDQLFYRNYEMLRLTQQSILEIIRHIKQLHEIIEDYYRVYFVNAAANLQKSKNLNTLTDKKTKTLSPGDIIEDIENGEDING